MTTGSCREQRNECDDTVEERIEHLHYRQGLERKDNFLDQIWMIEDQPWEREITSEHRLKRLKAQMSASPKSVAVSFWDILKRDLKMNPKTMM
jgi:hypothetical protein